MACRLCASPDALPFRVGDFEYEDCPRCGYIGLVRRFFPDRATEEARYRLHRNDLAQPDYRAYLSTFIDTALVPYLEIGAAVLDFGSGPEPALSRLLDERGYRTTSYDPFFAPKASWRHRVWEGIAVHEVAEHLRAPARTFAALAKRLAPGGLIAVRTRFPPPTRAEFAAWWYRRDSTHLGFFRPESFARLACRLGLELLLVSSPDIALLRLASSRP
jgi:hypothetical protein